MVRVTFSITVSSFSPVILTLYTPAGWLAGWLQFSRSQSLIINSTTVDAAWRAAGLQRLPYHNLFEVSARGCVPPRTHRISWHNSRIDRTACVTILSRYFCHCILAYYFSVSLLSQYMRYNSTWHLSVYLYLGQLIEFLRRTIDHMTKMSSDRCSVPLVI